MDSANARDCLLHLARAKLSERQDLVQLNDQFVDIIEHVHYMEAEHTALEHDYNLLKSGVQSDSSGINEIYNVEIRTVRSGIEEINRSRHELLNEQTQLSHQVKEAEQLWRHTAKSALGVPKEVDDEFHRICHIKMEDCITKRRIKYMEDKLRLIKQNNGRIFEHINLMRMRKDQAVSLQQEYLLRKNELLHSIRNMEEDNKKIIMNEHKYFVRDRNADRHVFRDQLRKAIADIRADYEANRLRNEEEIRIRLEREIHRMNTTMPGVVCYDKLREELSIVKNNLSGLQKQVSEVEIRNNSLTQQIEFYRLEISENNKLFEDTLEFKIKEIEKMREQCTAISVELEKLCDLNIDLQKEIAKYRELLDRSGDPRANAPSTQVIASALSRQNYSSISDHHSRTSSGIVQHTAHHAVRDSSSSRTGTTIHETITHTPIPIPATLPVQPIREYTYSRDASPIRPSYTPYQQESRADSRSSLRERIQIETLQGTLPVLPSHSVETIRASDNTRLVRDLSAGGQINTTQINNPYASRTPTSSVNDRIASERRDSEIRRNDALHQPYPIGGAVPRVEPTIFNERAPGYTHINSNFPLITPVTEGATVPSYYDTFNRNSSQRGPHHSSYHAATGSVSNSISTTLLNEGSIEHSSSSDSVDEDNFQRFTRWYKGRVKISDVTADFVQLVNRSSKKSADVGGFKLIHEFGNKSVYVDLPVGLILAPKDSLKIYARGATHERGAVIAEIDFFDTTIHTNTSIRNTNNEVKSWFVYTSNTEIGDADHHHH